MILRWFPLALFVVVFTPGLLHAQPQSVKTKITYVVDAEPNYDKMYEDIEIMRRILDKKLHGLYPSHTYYPTLGMVGMQGGMGGFNMLGGSGGMPGSMGGINGMLGGMGGMQGGMGMAGGMMPVTVPMRSLEGVYLKGQGVVYTATLASLQPLGKAKANSSTTRDYLTAIVQQESEWERVRRQVRNEKEKPKKPEASKPSSLSDVLLKVLAENGHNFSQLGANEGLTLVFTVHESNAPTPARKSGESRSANNSSASDAFDAGSALQDKVRDLALLGDLHVKQGHYGEAIATFEKALELKPDSNEAPTVCRKLAQCYLNLGEDAKGRALLDRAITLRKKAEEEKAKPASPKQAAVSLPVKLIISAPKKLLEHSKEGKITFEEFRRQAHVETLRFDNRR